MSAAQSNRQAMPIVAQIVDEIRAQGIDVRVVYAKENGIELGKKPQDENVFDIPQGYGRPFEVKGGAR